MNMSWNISRYLTTALITAATGVQSLLFHKVDNFFTKTDKPKQYNICYTLLRVEAGWHVSVVLCADEAASCRSLARSPRPSLATQCYVLHDACLQHCSLTSPRLASRSCSRTWIQIFFIVKHILSGANIWPEKCDQETFYSRHSCLSPDTSHAAVV